MTTDWLTVGSVAALVFTTSITPGPNNMMLLTSGARFGLRATLPHIFGIPVGFGSQIVLCVVGLGALIARYHSVSTLMGVACAMYLLWLAWRLAVQPPMTGSDLAVTSGRPMRWHEAVAFQFLNPKAWGVALAISTVVTAGHIESVPMQLAMAALSAIINLPCVSVWAAFGNFARAHLKNPRDFAIFNALMVLLLGATAMATLHSALQ
jgi:threonine/homoserine/homoserine lactone efflux protein